MPFHSTSTLLYAMANNFLKKKYHLHSLQMPALLLNCTVSSMCERIYKCVKDRKDYIYIYVYLYTGHIETYKETLGLKHYCSLKSFNQAAIPQTCVHSNANTGNYNLQQKTAKVQWATFKVIKRQTVLHMGFSLISE